MRKEVFASRALIWGLGIGLFALAGCYDSSASTSSETLGTSNKQAICHVPPGNPSNFHTIMVSTNGNAVDAHLAHGDVLGACDSVCEEVCDDGNPCTIDDCAEGGGCDNSMPVDCNDGVDCTVDACDPSVGCVYSPDDSVCADGVDCTVDACDPSVGCVNSPDDSACADGDLCTIDSCDPAIGCVNEFCPDDNNACTANGCDPVTGCFIEEIRCPERPCEVGTCDPVLGDCSYELVTCPDGQTCNPGTGECEVTGATCNTPACGGRPGRYSGLVLDGQDWQGTVDPFAGSAGYNDVADACANELIAQGCGTSYSTLFAACRDVISSDTACLACVRVSPYGDCTQCNSCRLDSDFYGPPADCRIFLSVDRCVEP